MSGNQPAEVKAKSQKQARAEKQKKCVVAPACLNSLNLQYMKLYRYP